MNAPEIPEHVLQFLAERIDSVPQLEALLLLWKQPEKSWSAEQIASRIYIESAAALQVLQALERRQLVVSDAETGSYRYTGTWDTTGTLMTEVAEQYRRHLVQLATLIHSGGSSSVREFARAFDLKKER